MARPILSRGKGKNLVFLRGKLFQFEGFFAYFGMVHFRASRSVLVATERDPPRCSTEMNRRTYPEYFL
mgnify:CR=1 FL=1